MTAKSQPQPGIRAFIDGTCPLCPEPIVRNVSRIVAKHGEWRHVACHLREVGE
jgi:hypothetical protein